MSYLEFLLYFYPLNTTPIPQTANFDFGLLQLLPTLEDETLGNETLGTDIFGTKTLYVETREALTHMCLIFLSLLYIYKYLALYHYVNGVFMLLKQFIQKFKWQM